MAPSAKNDRGGLDPAGKTLWRQGRVRLLPDGEEESDRLTFGSWTSGRGRSPPFCSSRMRQRPGSDPVPVGPRLHRRHLRMLLCWSRCYTGAPACAQPVDATGRFDRGGRRAGFVLTTSEVQTELKPIVDELPDGGSLRWCAVDVDVPDDAMAWFTPESTPAQRLSFSTPRDRRARRRAST